MPREQPKIVVVKVVPLVVSTRQAAQVLGVSTKYLAKLIKGGKLESFLEGNKRKVTMVSIEDYVAVKVAEGKPLRKGSRPLRPHEIEMEP